MSLSMQLNETCLLLQDGSRLLITLDQRPQHDKPLRDTTWCYALREAADGKSRQDLLDLLSLPLLPDQACAKKARDQAKMQKDAAAREKPGATRQRLLGYAQLSEWEAGHALCFSREMPQRIWELSADIVMLAYANGSMASRFRIIDLVQGTVLADTNGPGIDALAGGPIDFQRPSLEAALLDVARAQLGELARDLPPNQGKLPSRVSLVAAAHQHALFIAGVRGFVLVSCAGAAFNVTARLGTPNSWGVAVFCARWCVAIACGDRPDLPVLLVVNAGSGVIERRIALHEYPKVTNASASHSAQRVVFGCLDGQALVLDLPLGELRTCRVNFGLEPHASTEVSLSADGQWLTASTLSPPQATLVDLRDGSYAYLNVPVWQWHPLDKEADSPAVLRRSGVFAMDGGAEFVAEGCRHQVSAGELDFLPVRTNTGAALDGCHDPRSAANDPGEVDHSARIRLWLRPAVRLFARRQCADNAAVGSSKFGGMPDLPAQSLWPVYRGQPMAFLGQLNLADIGRVAGEGHRWPRKGLLSFFRAMDEFGPLFHQEDYELASAVVLYAPDPDALQRASKPRSGFTGGEFETPPCVIALADGMADLPRADSVHMRQSGMDHEDREDYLAFAQTVVKHDAGHDEMLQGHYAGGYPRVMQNNDLESCAERIVRGLQPYARDLGQMDAEIEDAAKKWIQLLQIGSCDETGWMWGEDGIMHWMIPAEDLAVARFDRVVVLGES